MLARLMLIFALTLAVVPAYAKGPLGSIKVGLWTGGAYTNDTTGAFSHCAAGVTYNSGIMMLVGLAASKNWTLGVMHPSWQLQVGESIPIVLTFEGREQYNVNGVAQNSTFVLVPMPQNSSLLSQFRKSKDMAAFAKGNTFQFALTSTSQLMRVLTNCVDRMNRGGMQAAGDFSVGASPAKGQTAAAPQPAAAPTPTTSSLSSPEVAALNQQVTQLYGQGKYKEATAVAEKALKLAERTLDKWHFDTLTSINNLAFIYKSQGRFSEAEPLYRRALEGFEQTLGKEHPSTLVTLDNLAELHRALGRYSEAEPLYRRALEAKERALGKEHPSTLATVNNLAELYRQQGRHAEAEPLYKHALEAEERTLGKEHRDTLVTVNNLALLYQAEGRYNEAETAYGHALEASERTLGKEHPDTLGTVNNLAELYRLQGRYGEAEPLYKRVLEARERTLGKEHPSTLSTVHNLAELYRLQGRFGEAEPLYRRALEAQGRTLGKDHPQTLTSATSLAALCSAQGRFEEAETLYKHALEAEQRTLGQEHPDTLVTIGNLGTFYMSLGRYSEAELILRRALEGYEHALGIDHPFTLTGVNNLAELLSAQGRYAQAELLYRRVLEASERMLGKEHPDTLGRIGNLALLYYSQGRYNEAEPLLQRALEASERVLGKEHPQTLTEINNLAMLYDAQGRHGEAEPLLKRILEVREPTLGKEHPDTLLGVNNLAFLYRAQGRYGEAEPLFRRAFEGFERTLGKENPFTLTSLSNLAGLYKLEGFYGQAEPLYRRALEASERTLGKEHPSTLGLVGDLAALYFVQNDWAHAAELWRRSTSVITAHTPGQAPTGNRISEADQSNWQFMGLVKTVYRLAPKGPMPDEMAAREAFQTAQWAKSSEARQALAQMAARGATGNPKLAALVRERQDLLFEWRKRDGLRNVWFGQPPEKRDARVESVNLARLAAIDGRIAEIDTELATSFPDYSAFVNPAPLRVEDVQALLGTDEALVLFLDTPQAKPTPEETFIWVVTKTDLRWVRSDLGTAALTREVQELRCGLDAAAWEGPQCTELTGQSYTEKDRDNGKPPPFDLARAHKLYQALFGQVEGLIKGKHLLVVPSGALTQLPFQVLVTAPPSASGDHKSAAWLVRDHAVTVLPAVSSLIALRRVARAGAATRPMIGFGNPLLDGDQNDASFGAYFKREAELAREKQRCPETLWRRVASLVGLRRGVTPVQTRGGLADVNFMRMQAPLPETADELCAVARALGAETNNIYLGARATEREIKRLSESGELSKYRIVHFATHGALAGQIGGGAEPGLLLTPPESPSENDDGYLSASEIAGLKLDADWVILSACNTAAGGAQGAEALSGLARAFIYAQARALLVSHWSVNSEATVKLVTSAIREISRDKRIGRAEGLRRAMLALIDKGKLEEAHPSYWAPFVVVGEGSAAQ